MGLPRGIAMTEKPNAIGELTVHERNPRTISADALEGLKASVAEFGDISGIVFNTKLGCLVTGHQRVEALKRRHGNNLKIQHDKTGGTIRPPDGDFRIRFVEWDQDRTDAALLVANNQAIQGEFSAEADAIANQVQASMPELFTATKMQSIIGAIQSQADGVQLKQVKELPAPPMAWVLIGIATVRFGEIAPMVEKIAGMNGTTVETTVASK